MKRWLFALLPLLLLGILISWRLNQKNAEAAAQTKQREMRTKTAPLVAAVPAEIRDLTETYEAVGSIEAPLNVKLSSKATGRVDFLEVREGARVNQGDVLVKIDPTEVEGQVGAARSAFAEAKYRLQQAELTLAPTDASVVTNIRQREADLASAVAAEKEVFDNSESRKAAMRSAITDAKGRVTDAEAAIKNAEASVRSAQANVDNAKTKLDRVTSLYKDGFIEAQAVDDAKAAHSVQTAALDVAKGELNSAIAKRDSMLAQQNNAELQYNIGLNLVKSNKVAAQERTHQAKAALEYAKANNAQKPAYRQNLEALKAAMAVAEQNLRSAEARRSDTVIKAPFKGYITGRFMDPGSMATPGAPILGIQAIKSVWVTLPVPEEVSRKVVFGMPLQFSVDSIPDRKFNAKIVQINPSADPNSRQFVMRAAIDNSNETFKPGMFARAWLQTSRIAGAIAVPREAIQNGKEGAYVVALDPGDGPEYITQHRPVTIGASDAAWIQITNGIQPGERVVTMTANPIKDGGKVRLGGPKKG